MRDYNVRDMGPLDYLKILRGHCDGILTDLEADEVNPHSIRGLVKAQFNTIVILEKVISVKISAFDEMPEGFRSLVQHLGDAPLPSVEIELPSPEDDFKDVTAAPQDNVVRGIFPTPPRQKG